MRTIKPQKSRSRKTSGRSKVSSLFGRFHGKLLPDEQYFDARQAMDEILHERWADVGTRRQHS